MAAAERTRHLTSFEAEPTEVAVGERARLSRASINTRQCFASGDWSGKLATSGLYTTPPLDADKTYTLDCKTAERRSGQRCA
ncbi:MAG TPA: hypothetical protein VF210_01485 [Pseudomonadales bacterium]